VAPASSRERLHSGTNATFSQGEALGRVDPSGSLATGQPDRHRSATKFNAPRCPANRSRPCRHTHLGPKLTTVLPATSGHSTSITLIPVSRSLAVEPCVDGWPASSGTRRSSAALLIGSLACWPELSMVEPRGTASNGATATPRTSPPPGEAALAVRRGTGSWLIRRWSGMDSNVQFRAR